VDNDWALEQLRAFVALSELKQPRSGGGVVFVGDSARPVGSHADIVAAAQVIEQILDRALPRWRTEVEDDGRKRWTRHRDAARRSIVQIERQEELATRLGENAPTLSAASLHPWVWDGAKSLWQSGHFRESVRAASVAINAHLQNKVGRRDLSEQPLFQEAFSNDEPKPGKPRLRPAGDDGGKTALSVRRGIVAFAEGSYAAVRNPASHDLCLELEESIALEQLAAFSMLARWVDESSVVPD